jgi:parallel beta-helix repeat protein
MANSVHRGFLRAGASQAARVLALLGLVAGASPARAAHLACGDVLGPGVHVMDADLLCSSASTEFGLELASGARLDMQGHEIAFDVGGTGTGVLVTGTGAQLSRGRIRSTNTGIRLEGGGGHRISGMSVQESNTGLWLEGASDNVVFLSDVSNNFNTGVLLRSSDRNHFVALKVNDQSGTAMIGGFRIESSDENAIVFSEVSRNACIGIHLADSSRSTVQYNVVNDNDCPFQANAGVGIALTGDSDRNAIRNNSASRNGADFAGALGDGINVGCRDGCGFESPSTGADDNVVTDNVARDNRRYGIAEEPGNLRNVYRRNVATGNAGGDFAIGP